MAEFKQGFVKAKDDKGIVLGNNDNFSLVYDTTLSGGAGAIADGTIAGVTPTLDDHLTTKEYVDSAVASGTGSSGAQEYVENFTLDGTDISNKYVTLTKTPTESQVFVEGGIKGTEDTDYTVSTKNIDWSGYAWEGVLEVGDILSVLYYTDDLTAIENITLNGTDVSNKYITLINAPSTTQAFVEGGLKGLEDTDYTVSGTQVNWSGYDWQSGLESGDILSILYWT
jgi:hypothetical protein